MFEPVRIAPSILSADFLHFADQIALLEDAGAGYIHYDVIDGHFAPNLTVGIPLLKQLAKESRLPVDVHLMVDNPLRQIPWFIEAGAKSISVHAEALNSDEMHKAIDLIHEAKIAACLALKPKTPVSVLTPVINEIDMALIMCVEPGFSGQAYRPGSERKVGDVVELARKQKASPLIQVDGGIGKKTAPLVCACGADVLVCGNAVFGAEDPARAIAEIAHAAETARAISAAKTS